jgi:hypothetical protein
MKLFDAKLEDELNPSVAVKLVETFLSPALGKQFKQRGFYAQTEPPYSLSEELEVHNFQNVLSPSELAEFKVYLMTEMNWYRERQQQGTAQQPKDRVFAFLGDRRKCKHLGWGFNQTWIQAEHWSSAVTSVISKLQQKYPSFTKEHINAAFLTCVFCSKGT